MFCVNKDGIHTKFVGCRQTQTSTKGVNSIIYLCRFHNKVKCLFDFTVTKIYFDSIDFKELILVESEFKINDLCLVMFMSKGVEQKNLV